MNFFEEAEKVQRESVDMGAVKSELEQHVRNYSMLMRDYAFDWTETSAFEQLTRTLGEYPPLKLLEDLLKHYTVKRDTIQVKEIPALLINAGLKKVTTESGIEVSTKSHIHIKRLNDAKLEKFLREHDSTGIIKERLEFQKGDLQDEYIQFLEEKGVSYEKKVDINTNSLKKVVKDIYEETEQLPPEDCAEVSFFTKANIK